MATAIQEENIILYVIVRLKSVQEYMFQYKIINVLYVGQHEGFDNMSFIFFETGLIQ